MRYLHLALLPAAGLMALGSASRSVEGQVLSRYSWAWSGVLVLGWATLLVAVGGVTSGRPGAVLAGTLRLFGTTYLLSSNNGVASSSWSLAMAAMARHGLAVVLLSSGISGQWRLRRRGAFMVGVLLGSLTLVDTVFPAVAGMTSPLPVPGSGFRQREGLDSLSRDGIAVVGDSFVWGAGVREGDAFPAQVERSLTAAGAGTPVYNLGQEGAGLPDYLAVIEKMSPVRRIVVCFYMNDVPERQTAARKSLQAFRALGRSSLSLRLLGDLAGAATYAGSDSYLASVVAEYDRDDPTFERRWAEAVRLLGAIGIAARSRSRETPVLVIFPLMRDFRAYPLRSAHSSLGEVGRREGFRVEDMPPVFESDIRDPRARSVDGSQFDAGIHALVARTLVGAFLAPSL